MIIKIDAYCPGANLAVDIPWKWLNFFLDDDAELENIGKEYAAGKMLTGQVKKRLIEVKLPRYCLTTREIAQLRRFCQTDEDLCQEL